MKNNFTEELLLFLADCLNCNKNFLSWQILFSISGDPRLIRHRYWVERYIKNRRLRKKLYNAAQNLKRRGYLSEKVFGKSHGYVLTPKANIKIFKLKLKEFNKKKLPSGKWLMVFFDIPEKRRKDRDAFRSLIIDLGFEQLQKSVWATRFDVLRQLKGAIENSRLEEYVKPLLVSELEK